jgi:hypothetical protein
MGQERVVLFFCGRGEKERIEVGKRIKGMK